MSLPFKRSAFFGLGLIAITVLYCLYYLYFIYHLSREIPLRAMHFMKFMFILTAYGIGYAGLKRLTQGWMMQIWHLVYFVCLLVLLGMGIYDWSVGRVAPGLRVIADDIQEFLVSPLLYAGIGLLAGKFDQRNG